MNVLGRGCRVNGLDVLIAWWTNPRHDPAALPRPPGLLAGGAERGAVGGGTMRYTCLTTAGVGFAPNPCANGAARKGGFVVSGESLPPSGGVGQADDLRPALRTH